MSNGMVSLEHAFGQLECTGAPSAAQEPAPVKKVRKKAASKIIGTIEPEAKPKATRKRMPKVAATATPPLPPSPEEPSLREMGRILVRKARRTVRGASRFVRLHVLLGLRNVQTEKRAAAKASA